MSEATHEDVVEITCDEDAEHDTRRFAVKDCRPDRAKSLVSGVMHRDFTGPYRKYDAYASVLKNGVCIVRVVRM